MGRSNKQNQTLPPAPVVEHIAPAPVVSPEGNFFAAPAPVEKYIAPASAVYAALAPVVEYLAPVPSDVQAPTPVVESIAQCHAPVFPLSPDASDTSSPEDMYTSSWVSLPVPIKTCTTDVSAEAEGQGVRDTGCDTWSRTSGGQPRQGGEFTVAL